MAATPHHPPRRYSGAWQKKPLRQLLEETNTFVHIVELVTSRGLITEQDGRKVLSLARRLSEHPEFHALSITDNPGGNAMMNPDILGTDLISRGQDVIIHISCKDWNRNAIQGRAWQLASEGFNNILALSGDYPVSGFKGNAGAVFDIDSVGLLDLLETMNRGMKVNRGKKTQRMDSTSFYLGTVVNNHKRHEREVMPQYFKLVRKIQAGAAFVIAQIGYDARKQDELLKYMAMYRLNVPVIANVYVLSPAAARFFHRGRIPGVVVGTKLMDLVESRSKDRDRGKAFFLELAAKQCAIARGLGYHGVYLGGHLKYDDYEHLLGLAAGYGSDDWRAFARELNFSFVDEFYFFEAEGDSGLSSTQVNRSYLASLEETPRRKARSGLPLSYKFNRWIHDRIFAPGSTGFRLGSRLAMALEGRLKATRLFHAGEQLAKITAFDCRDCGDCSLPDIAYLCPESQCVKNQRNGPCGGTRQGKCEIGDKECIWARAYDRLKGHGEEQLMAQGPPIIKNAGLEGTSAWLNTFTGKDHHGTTHENQ